MVLLDHMRGYHPAELKAMDEDNARQAEELAKEMAAAAAEAAAMDALTSEAAAMEAVTSEAAAMEALAAEANAVGETEVVETAKFMCL